MIPFIGIGTTALSLPRDSMHRCPLHGLEVWEQALRLHLTAAECVAWLGNTTKT